jgi:hypothetical protein
MSSCPTKDVIIQPNFTCEQVPYALKVTDTNNLNGLPVAEHTLTQFSIDASATIRITPQKEGFLVMAPHTDFTVSFLNKTYSHVESRFFSTNLHPFPESTAEFQIHLQTYSPVKSLMIVIPLKIVYAQQSNTYFDSLANEQRASLITLFRDVDKATTIEYIAPLNFGSGCNPSITSTYLLVEKIVAISHSSYETLYKRQLLPILKLTPKDLVRPEIHLLRNNPGVQSIIPQESVSCPENKSQDYEIVDDIQTYSESEWLHIFLFILGGLIGFLVFDYIIGILWILIYNKTVIPWLKMKTILFVIFLIYLGVSCKTLVPFMRKFIPLD